MSAQAWAVFDAEVDAGSGACEISLEDVAEARETLGLSFADFGIVLEVDGGYLEEGT